MSGAGDGRGPAAVLFDMDGLLVDSEGTWFEVETEVMAALGAPWGHEHQVALLGGALENTSRYMAEVARASGAAPVPWREVADRLVAGMARRLHEEAKLLPGAAELLDELIAAEVPRALVSSSVRVLVDAVLGSVRVGTGRDPFAVSVAGDEVTRRKPDPEPYRRAAERLGVPAARCVVLEDSPAGVAAGEAAGCRVVAVPSLVSIPPAAGRLVVPSLLDVDLDLLGSLVGAAP